MSELQVTYDEKQHCTALQENKGNAVATDCSYIGKGEEFSPVELVRAGLASCMLMSMGTLAMRDKLDISGTCADVEVSTKVTRIGAIDLTLTMPRDFSAADRVKLEKAAWICPIKKAFIMISRSLSTSIVRNRGRFLELSFLREDKLCEL